MNSNNMIVVSSNYLKSVYVQSKKYSFNLIGYGSFKLLLENLHKINLTDIMGIVYLDDFLPRGDELDNLKSLLNLLNVCRYDGKVLFAVSELNKYSISILDKYKNISINYIEYDEDVTDITVNNFIFSSVLLHKGGLYLINNEEDTTKNIKWDTPSLTYFTLLRSSLFKVLENVTMRDTVSETVEMDIPCIKLRSNGNKAEADLRVAYIYAMFGMDRSDILDRYTEDVEHVILGFIIKSERRVIL